MTSEPVLYRALTATAGRSPVRDASLEDVLKAPVPWDRYGDGGQPGLSAAQPALAGYSACFLSALQFVAAQDRVRLPATIAVTETAALAAIPNGFAIQVDLRVSVPGMPLGQARELIDKAHIVCPYSRVTRNTVDVRLTLV